MDQSAWEPGLSQLVSALLQLHEHRVQRRGMQRGKPIRRLPVLLGLLRLLLPFKEPQSFRSQEQASSLYQQLIDKDMVSAVLEINMIEHQLSLLDDRRALQERPNEGPQRPATPQELELAARALLLYYLQGQTTDDPLFRETQTAFQEVWKSEKERTASIMEGAGTGRRERVATASAKEMAALDTYRSHWDRWLAEQLGGRRVESES